MSPEETLRELGSTQEGLSQVEAQERLNRYGLNELRKERKSSPVKMFLQQFADVLIIILLAAISLSIAIGEWLDALVIIAIVLATAILGFVQEFRSEKAVEVLKKMVAPTAIVVREGKEAKVPASNIVPGDILFLYTGDKVSADARLIESVNLKIDEASLTGESSPVRKTVDAIGENVPISDRSNMVFTGTIIVYGRGRGVTTSTGMNTEFGKIAKMVQTERQQETPLEKRTKSVGKWIGILSVAICIGVAVIGILENRGIIDMLLWGVSLAVAAVPESLPAIVTGALAVGMYRMAKVNTIVKKLPAVETLGCTGVICSDKTGTMTKGEMTVQRIFVNDRTMKVSGIGYEPEGEFLFENKKAEPDEELRVLLSAATLCNDSKLEKEAASERWVIKGDPTEGALIVAAAKAHIWKTELEKEQPRVGEIPFSSETKRMTTVHLAPNKAKMAYMKGAPEIVLGKCTKLLSNDRILELTDDLRTEILKVNETMARQALRNLGFALRKLPETVEVYDENIEEDFTFVGIVGMIDPPREEVKEALYTCKKAGINVVMVTGDHKLTAIAVAKELNLLGEGEEEKDQVLTGAELEKLTDEQLASVVEKVVIYARVSPEHKMRIVKAWKSKGKVVAMTGDGVNDAPALKMSDIGVAMGITGTEVTKEASDMVLTDDNFASIVKAAREGREIYDNIKKYLTYLMRCNIMEILVMFITVVSVPYLAKAYAPGATAGVIGSATIALTASQLLWVNLITDGLPAIALGIDPGDPDIMERKPRDPKESIFTKSVKLYLSLVPVLMTTLLLFGYFFYRPWEGSAQLAEGRTQLLTAMVMMELANAISARSLRYPVWKVGIFKNRFLWYAVLSSFFLQLLVLYTPGLNSAFNVSAPEPLDWGFAALFTGISFSALEIGKWVASRKRR